MAEVIISGEPGSLNPGREIVDEQLRALEFYISGMSDHPVGMPWASMNMKTGQLELEGDRGDMDPPIRLATTPSFELMGRFLSRDRSVTFNPVTRVLETHQVKR